MVEKFYSYDKLPSLTYENLNDSLFFIGCNILSEYDEDRIKIKDHLNPKRIFHRKRYLYGIFLDPKKEHLSLIQQLNSVKDIDFFTYEKIISEFNFTCKENFAYLEDGVYPLDPSHVCEYMPNLKYDDFFEDNTEIPIYQKIKYLNFLILTP